MHKNWLNYWKDSLIDSQRLQIDFERETHFAVKEFELASATVPADKIEILFLDQEKRINKKKNITNPNDEIWIKLKTINVIFSLFTAIPKVEHLSTFKTKKPAYPFWISAQVNRKGTLSKPEELFPLIPREHLVPSAGKESDFILGDVENVDKANVFSETDIKNWGDYNTYLKKVFKKVSDQELENYSSEEFEIVKESIFFCPDEKQGAASGIINLYHHLLKKSKQPALLKNLIKGSTTAKKSTEVSKYMSLLSNHLGQMSDSFPLSITQRKTLLTFTEEPTNNVFAVNGPPGTGKTTLLQSIVANEVVKAAINGKDAPIILACSTNNQAVTNINESFSKSQSSLADLPGRWLPDFEGYASYLPSAQKSGFELAGINYIKLDGTGTFQNLENFDYLEKAKPHFLSKMKVYSNTNFSNIKQATKALQEELKSIQASLELLSSTWKEYQTAWLQFSKYYKSTSHVSKYLQNGIADIKIIQSDIDWFIKTETAIESYFRKESIWRKLGCFLGISYSIGLRELAINNILESSPVTLSRKRKNDELSLLTELRKHLTTAKAIQTAIAKWMNLCSSMNLKGTPPESEERIWQHEWEKIQTKNSVPCYLHDELDVSLRHKAFQLAVHYWEARWLDEVSGHILDSKKDSKGYFPTISRWKTRSMLTPCYVSTFYMAPKFFSYWERDDENEGWANPPLSEMVDILMVDEAGQTTPEVGTAIFGLAKRAIVVGDIKQIEPIWNIPSKIDEGNLTRHTLLTENERHTKLDTYETDGVLATNGSIMKMAQRASLFKEKELPEKGLLLREHRRCYNEIIEYCNILAYSGQLVPMKGTKNPSSLFPAIQLIDVAGNSIVKNKDRFNIEEAEAIAQFLITNKSAIEQETDATIELEVGIITPFVGQKRVLKNTLKQAGFDINKMKIGTVHALQGAERSIIIFSSVYGEGDVGTMFFDRDNKPNMLNVAVSRAKDSFLIFGNKRIFDSTKNTPSGKLAKYLGL
ncbi:DEAD/DEAH box helicase [Cellulophaga baltica]|uniref:DEAD/DEAH box helicase n=1 Tax=Cellulophaga baltica TaxID=76594 RepID=UPI002494F391|nr:DEAD/DEAH box helicase [Cellulophaga baltica]